MLDKPDEEWTFVDVLILLFHRKKMLSGLFVGGMIVAFLLSLTFDMWYRSSAVILLPDRALSPIETLSGNLGSLGQSLTGLSGSGSPNSQRYVAIVNSVRMRESLIGPFDLMNRFDLEYTAKDTQAILKEMMDWISVQPNTKDGTITIDVAFKEEKEKAADMARFVVKRLDEINRQLATEQARATRIFIEERYMRARHDLKNAEDSLNAFQKTFGVVSFNDQLKASIEAAAQLYAQLSVAELDYDVKKQTFGNTHPDLLRLEYQINELRHQQHELETGGSVDQGILIPFKAGPDLGLQYLRLFREVQFQTKVVEFLIPQFEQAKIQEAKDTPTLLVLDEPMIPARHFKPRKSLLSLAGGLMAFLVGCVWIVCVEKIRFIDQPSDVPHKEKLRQLMRLILWRQTPHKE